MSWWRREARLYVCGNGQGSPCLDLRRIPNTLADATVGTDLVVVEGMGRAIHTNYRRAQPHLVALAVQAFQVVVDAGFEKKGQPLFWACI